MKQENAGKGKLLVELPNDILAFIDAMGEGSRPAKIKRLLKEAMNKSNERILNGKKGQDR